jgi:FkbM family methyltransferase
MAGKRLHRLLRAIDFARMLFALGVPFRNRLRIFSTRAFGGAVHLGPGRAVTASLYGIRMEIPEPIATPRICEALRKGGYEGCEVLAFEELARPGDSILEVGAGLGFLTSYMARDPRTHRIAAFEADSRLLAVAQRTCALNGVNVALFHAAVGRRSGVAEFALHPDFWASSTETWDGAQLVDVPMIALDSCLNEHKPNVLVLDVEGGEYDLLPNADLRDLDVVVVELHPWQSDPARTEALFASLAKRGYRHVHHARWGNVHGFIKR